MGREPGRTGGGRGREAGSTLGREAVAEIKKAIVCYYWVLLNQKHLPSKVLICPFNITSA